MKSFIPSPEAGHRLAGCHNQLSLNDVVSPIHIALMKLLSDFSFKRKKSIRTFETAKGFEVADLNDGNTGVVGLLKSNHKKTNSVITHGCIGKPYE